MKDARLLTAKAQAERKMNRLRARENRLYSLLLGAGPSIRWWWRLRWTFVNAAALDAQQDFFTLRRLARRRGLIDHRTNRT